MAEIFQNRDQNIEHVVIYNAGHRMRFSCIAGLLEHPIACVQHRSVWLGLMVNPSYNHHPLISLLLSHKSCTCNNRHATHTQHARSPTAQGKQGKWQKKTLSGNTQGIWVFCQNTGNLVCSSCKFPDSKGKRYYDFCRKNFKKIPLYL